MVLPWLKQRHLFNTIMDQQLYIHASLVRSLIIALATRFPCLDTFGIVFYQGFHPVAEANTV